MEIKIENILILWDEKVTDIFVSLINTLSLSFSEKEIRKRNGNPQFNGETFRKRELRKAVRLRLRSASPLGSPKDDNRPRKGNGEPTFDC